MSQRSNPTDLTDENIMSTSPAHPPTPVKPAISSFTGMNNNETSLSSALAETVASLACFGSPSRPLERVDANGSVGKRCAPEFRDTSRKEAQAAAVGNENSLESSHEQFLLDLSLRISTSAETSRPPQHKSQQPQQKSLVSSPKQGGIDNEKRVLNESESAELQAMRGRTAADTEGPSVCTPTALSLANKTITCQEPPPEVKPSATKETRSLDQRSILRPTLAQKDAKKTIKIQEPALKDSLSHTVASLATLSNFATPNRKPTRSASSTPTASSRVASNVCHHSRSLSGPIVSGTAFSAVVALQNKGLGSDASVNSSGSVKNCALKNNMKSTKEEGSKSSSVMCVHASSSTIKKNDSMNHPTAALEQIAMISDSISRGATSNNARASNTKLESKKRPSPFSKLTATNFSKKTLTRCSDGAPIIAGTAAAAMAIATAARIATTNSDNGTAKLMHGFGVVEDDDTLDRVVSLSTRAVLGISGECHATLAEREKTKNYSQTPKVLDREKANRVTPEEQQSKEEENLSSSCSVYQVSSSQSSQPLHQNPSSSSTLSSQPGPFVHSSNNKNCSAIGGARGVGGMDILADIICHVPPMVVPQSSSASASGVYSLSHNSLHPPQHHHDCYAIPSHQETHHERTSVHHPQQHRQLPTGINIPAIPSYQEIYQEMGIAPQNYHRGNDPSTGFYHHQQQGKVFKAEHEHNHPSTLYSMKEIRHINSTQSDYPPPNCIVETISSNHSNCNNIDGSAQSQSRLMSTHYGHALSGEIEEGKELYTRKDLMVMGGHMLEQKDVHGSMKEGADSVVLCNLERDIREGDGLCWFLYSCDRNNGGGALCRSYHKKRAIRVFRSSILGGRYAPPYLDEDEDDEIGYRYDGLYMVRAVWDINGNETESFPCVGEDGWQTYFFTRLPKKPLDGKTEPGIQYNAMGLQELWGSIQKMRGVRKPKKFDIPPAPMKLPPLKRAAISGDNKDRKVASSRPQKVQAKELLPEKDDDCGKKQEEETSATSCGDDTSEQRSSAGCKSETGSSSRQEKSPHIVSRPVPNKVVTPRPRISSVSTQLPKAMSPTLSSEQKRPASAETSDSSDSETETSAAPKRMKTGPPTSTTPSATKRTNNLAQVISTLLPKRATAAKAEAANRDMFGKKKKRPYNRKSTSAPSPGRKRAKQSSKTDDTSSSSSVDNVDPNVLTIGSRVLVLYKGSLFKATIRKRRKNKDTHDFQIHYDGNKKSNVHWVPIDRIQEILSIAIDTASDKKLDGNKGKRGGWNKKKSESVPEESDSSDDEGISDKKTNHTKKLTLQDACNPKSEGIDRPNPNETEPEPKEKADPESDDVDNSTMNLSEASSRENLENSDEETQGKDQVVIASSDPIEESVAPSEDPIIPRMKLHESNASASSNSLLRTRITVFDNVEVPPEDAVTSPELTSMLNNDEAKVSTEKSSMLSSYDDGPPGFDADAVSDKEISDSSSDREDAKEQEAGDPTSELKFPIGAHVYVEYRRIFYSSTVLQARRKRNSTEYLVHYEGYKKASDRWVKENDLRQVNAETTLRFEEQRIVSSNIAFDSELSGPSDYSMTTRQKTSNTDNHVHHHFTREKPPRRARSDTSDLAQLEDIESGVAFLPGSVVFVEWSGALYLAKMVKKRFTGDRTEYLVSYDGFDSDHDAWISINNIYEVNPQTKRVFNRMNAEIKSGGKLKKPDPPITRYSGKKKRESSSTRSSSHAEQKPMLKAKEPKKGNDDEFLTYSDPPLPRRRETRKTQDDESITTSDRGTQPSQATSGRLSSPSIDMQGIPSGVEFLPGSTLFAERKGCLCVAKMLKKRGKGEHMEYYIQFNDGTDDSESIWISTSLVYEINPQTKRVFRQLSKKVKL
ncbi:hypothetical protein HJC23_009640 [Cyclotella cryptica]|uniref:Chromo domain-containing protein n=1 Tax=Cyclotella cryptica TaxID=29204 RepID=A0ABD3PWT3_9STRA|eukprot:CCRYP_010906-RD/>CCRYP_010906-RD protein AED:0.03 eAED:0.03 QI:202/1/1/1/0.71/0.62/8/3288/1860